MEAAEVVRRSNKSNRIGSPHPFPFTIVMGLAWALTSQHGKFACVLHMTLVRTLDSQLCTHHQG